MRYLAAVLIVALGACNPPVPQPTPSPSPSPTVEPTPEPTPVPTPTATPIPIGCQPVALDFPVILTAQYVGAVRTAQEEIGDVCGQDPVQSLQRLALRLTAKGLCAFQDEDRVFVGASQDAAMWEEHHAVYWGNYCWISNTYRNTFTRK